LRCGGDKAIKSKISEQKLVMIRFREKKLP